MLRALALAALLFAAPNGVVGQGLPVLHIRVTVVDADRRSIPVARHALLVSDNPPSAAPRRVVTSPEGTVDVRLPPGNYTVESDKPVAVLGKSYEWTRMIDIVLGRDATLELNADNAAVAEAVATDATTPLVDGPSLMAQWQDSVVTLWTPHAHASGFLVDARGLILTSQRAIGDATSIEAQLSSTVKVAATVLAADPTRDVAVLWVDRAAVAGVRPVLLSCPPSGTPAVAAGQEIVTIDVSLHGQKSLTSGAVSRIESQGILADFDLSLGSPGGPVFASDGTALGVTSRVDDGNDRARANVRVTRVAEACAVMGTADAKMAGAAPPNGVHLPVESERPLPVAALRAAVEGRPFSMNPYQMSSSDFDITFITPTLLFGAEAQQGRTGGDPDKARAVADFGEWSEYVEHAFPVLLVRVSPKLVESFWMKVARGAAGTQGISMPPIKRLRPGFSRMRVMCGGTEVTPIHPFKITQRVSETDAIEEGLYAFDPAAIGPHCGSVTLVLYSAKDPEHADTLVVDPGVTRRIWEDFAQYRQSADRQ